jgi:hypothetical protein
MKRFWSKVSYGAPGECWLWLGSKDKGYGHFRWSTEKKILAHRVAYMLAKPSMFNPALHVLHSCDNPSCVRPSHLFQGTDADNAHDREVKGRGNQPRGENVSVSKLTADQVLAIRADPRSNIKIAANYDVSDVAVSCIKRRKTWKHI